MLSFDVFFDEQIVEMPVIWNVMALMWRHCDDFGTITS